MNIITANRLQNLRMKEICAIEKALKKPHVAPSNLDAKHFD